MMIDMNIPQVVELEKRRQVLAFEIEHGRPATARQASLVDLLSGQASAGPRETED